MTEEQKRQAEIALSNSSNSFLMTFEQKIAFSNHLEAIEWIDTYNLPYRISFDYLKAWDRSKGYVEINPCYPMPGYRVDDLIHLKPNEFTPHDPSKPPNKDGSYSLCLTPINPEVRQQVKEVCYKLRPWNLETAAGRKKWEYEFAHFLGLAQLNAFNYFDWFGIKEAPDEVTANKNQQKIDYWLNLQADYLNNKGNYRQEEPPYLPSYEAEYTLLQFVPIWDNNGKDGM